MKVLLGCSALNKAAGGVRTHVIDLAFLLKAKGIDVIVCSSGGEFVEQLEQAGIKHITIPFREVRVKKYKIISCIFKLLYVCWKNKVDIIHCHTQPMIVAANFCRRLFAIPYVWTCHNSQQPLVLRKIRKLGKFPAIAVSTDLKKMLLDGYGFHANEVKVVFNGIDLAKYHTVDLNERLKIRQRYHIPQDAYVISDVAALNGGKGQNILLEAVKIVQQKHWITNIVVYLAGGTNTKGDMEYACYLDNYARENGINLIRGGYQPARDVYGMSDLACIPSLVEGFSISSLEAFVMKCPLIRSASAGCSDMADCCIVVPLNNAAELAEKIIYAITHKDILQNMANIAYENVLKRFTDTVMVDNIVSTYEHIKNGNNSLGEVLK